MTPMITAIILAEARSVRPTRQEAEAAVETLLRWAWG